VFSWIEWPDKATRDAAMGRMEELMKTDDRLNPEKNPMPFDGKRMISGGSLQWSSFEARTTGDPGASPTLDVKESKSLG
jgi:uncharacterized protein YbaA (DUF1428 family)